MPAHSAFQSFSRPAGRAQESNLYREIRSQPQAIAETVEFQRRQIAQFGRFLKDKRPACVDVVAAGSSKNAAMIGQYLTGGLILNVQEPSEYRPVSDIAIVVSQSGESTDVIRCVERMAAAGVAIAAVTNSPESTLSRKSGYQIFTMAGEERAIAATGTMTCAVATFFHLGLEIAGAGIGELEKLPGQMSAFLSLAAETGLGRVVGRLRDTAFVAFLGQNEHKWVAAEAALKLGETAEVITTYGSTPMFRHGYCAAFGATTGPVSGVEKAMFILDSGSADESLLEQGMNGKWPVFRMLIGRGRAGDGIAIPAEGKIGSIIVPIVAAQILAHDLAVEKGIEPGESAILSKVVK